MVIQLLMIGYALVYIFDSRNPLVVLSVLFVMLMAASWIALRPLRKRSRAAFARALVSIAMGGGTTFVFVTQGVLQLDPWFAPRYCIPLAGMIFSSSMNTVSLAAERFESESADGKGYYEARHIALRSALIPVINSLFAVGLVMLPGMMTGQILSGVSPHIAVRYQVMVMCMSFGSAGISAACFLALAKSSDESHLAVGESGDSGNSPP
jgi:putative ABC transport system permease protein